jgi:outer membrane immunogenic protein
MGSRKADMIRCSPSFRKFTMTRPLHALALCLGLAAAPAAAESFSGPRIEATIGYDRLSSHDDFDDLPDTLAGARIGGAIGYDVAMGPRLLVGVEAGAGWTIGARKTTTLARDRLHQDLGRDLDLSLRLGWKMSPTLLGYVKAGYANSRFDVRYDAAIIGGYDSIRSHAVRGGVRLGVGIEHSLGGRLYAKGEYRWTRYPDDAPYTRNVTRNQVLFGVGARF